METGLIKIDPSDFGLEDKQVEGIEVAFESKLAEIQVMNGVYEGIINKGMSRDVAEEAGTARKKLVKIRTGIAKIHKTQKAFFLASGRYIDAWKNKETEPVTQMEEKLSDMENYYVKLEQDRIDKLHEKRHAEIELYIDEENLRNFGEMTDEDYGLYFKRAKKRYDDLKAIEEKEKKDAEELKAKEKAEKKKLKKENEKLRKEKDEREKKQIEAQAKRDKEDKEREEAIIEAEAVELAKGDVEKLKDLCGDLLSLKTKYTFSNENYQKAYRNVGKLIDKIVNYINDK